MVLLQGGRVGVVCRLDRGQLCIQPAGPHENIEGVTLPRRLALQHFRVAHAQQVWGHTHISIRLKPINPCWLCMH